MAEDILDYFRLKRQILPKLRLAAQQGGYVSIIAMVGQLDPCLVASHSEAKHRPRIALECLVQLVRCQTSSSHQTRAHRHGSMRTAAVALVHGGSPTGQPIASQSLTEDLEWPEQGFMISTTARQIENLP